MGRISKLHELILAPYAVAVYRRRYPSPPETAERWALELRDRYLDNKYGGSQKLHHSDQGEVIAAFASGDIDKSVKLCVGDIGKCCACILDRLGPFPMGVRDAALILRNERNLLEHEWVKRDSIKLRQALIKNALAAVATIIPLIDKEWSAAAASFMTAHAPPLPQPPTKGAKGKKGQAAPPPAPAPVAPVPPAVSHAWAELKMGLDRMERRDERETIAEAQAARERWRWATRHILDEREDKANLMMLLLPHLASEDVDKLTPMLQYPWMFVLDATERLVSGPNPTEHTVDASIRSLSKHAALPLELKVSLLALTLDG
jgi:hypothetical protein